jgi:hypothetical protein
VYKGVDMNRSALLWLASLSLAVLAFSSPLSAGCICKNYTGKSFCAENILSCQAQAGNCAEECTWDKANEPKKKPKKGQKNDDPKKKSMLIF